MFYKNRAIKVTAIVKRPERAMEEAEPVGDLLGAPGALGEGTALGGSMGIETSGAQVAGMLSVKQRSGQLSGHPHSEGVWPERLQRLLATRVRSVFCRDWAALAQRLRELPSNWNLVYSVVDASDKGILPVRPALEKAMEARPALKSEGNAILGMVPLVGLSLMLRE